MAILFYIPALILALTFAIGPVLYDPAVFLTFDLPKMTLLQMGIESAILARIALFMAQACLPARQGSGLMGNSLKLDTVRVLVGTFVLINILAAWFAHLPSQAWWGNYYRRQGLWVTLHYVALFVMVLDMARNRRLRSVLLHGILLGAFANSLVTLLEHLGIPDYAAWKNVGSYAGRLVSPFGQPNLMAAYQGMIVPLWIALSARSLMAHGSSLPAGGQEAGLMGRPKNVSPLRSYSRIIGHHLLKSFYTLGLALGLFSIVGSESRGAWVAGAGTLFMALACLPARQGSWVMGRRKLKAESGKPKAEQGAVRLWRTLRMTAVIIMAVAAVGGLGYQLVQSNPDLDWRLQQLVTPSDWPNIERYQIWRRTADLVARRPVFGYGHDNLELVLPASLQPEDNLLQQLYVDRAHNGYLERLVNTGVLGLLSFLSLVGFALWRGIKLSDSLDKGLVFALGLGALFYLIEDLFNISGGYLDAVLWVFLALMIGIGRQQAAGSKQLEVDSQKLKAESLKPGEPRLVHWLRTLGYGLGLMLLVSASVFSLRENGRLYEADKAYKLALRSELVGYEEALPHYEEAIALAPDFGLYRMKYADAAIQLGYRGETETAKKLLAQTREILLAGEGWGTEAADYYYRLAQVYEYGRESLASDFVAQANHYYALAHQWAPYKFAAREI